MNQKVLLAAGAAVLVLVIAGGLLFANKANNTKTPSQTSTVQELSPTSEVQSPTPTDAEQNEATVTLTSTGFSPKTVTIKVGDKVVWNNESGKDATVNSAPHPVHTSYPLLNLGGFSDGETLELVFEEAGTYNYHNHLNASQTGSVTVE